MKNPICSLPITEYHRPCSCACTTSRASCHFAPCPLHALLAVPLSHCIRHLFVALACCTRHLVAPSSPHAPRRVTVHPAAAHANSPCILSPHASPFMPSSLHMPRCRASRCRTPHLSVPSSPHAPRCRAPLSRTRHLTVPVAATHATHLAATTTTTTATTPQQRDCHDHPHHSHHGVSTATTTSMTTTANDHHNYEHDHTVSATTTTSA